MLYEFVCHHSTVYIIYSLNGNRLLKVQCLLSKSDRRWSILMVITSSHDSSCQIIMRTLCVLLIGYYRWFYPITLSVFIVKEYRKNVLKEILLHYHHLCSRYSSESVVCAGQTIALEKPCDMLALVCDLHVIHQILKNVLHDKGFGFHFC